jgi:DNA-binding NtrC family response regulator
LIQLLEAYRFPGNVRELEAMVFDAVARHHQGNVLSLASFRELILGPGDAPAPEAAEEPGTTPGWLQMPTLPTLQQAEEALVAEALRRASGNQGVAAGLLGISRQALNKRLMRQRQGEEAAE